jgi:2-polyprenyl-3-methyl-5-hydroxy-6-metoxy-1,4-benzoquinol methylase
MDVVQNSTRHGRHPQHARSSAVAGRPYSVILCTEVLEHVADIDAAFAGLRVWSPPRRRWC